MTDLLQEFDEHVRGFAQSSLSDRDLLLNFAMGLSGEVGEVTDLLKKYLYHGDPIDQAKLVKECGDVCWYWFALLQRLECDRISAFVSTQNHRITINEDFPGYVLWMSVQAGNVSLQIINSAFDGPDLDLTMTLKAMQNLLGSLLIVLERFEISIETVLNANIEKLRARHGGTTFDREVQRASKAAESEA